MLTGQHQQKIIREVFVIMKDMPTDETKEIIKDVPDEIIKDTSDDKELMENNVVEEVSKNGQTGVNADNGNKRAVN